MGTAIFSREVKRPRCEVKHKRFSSTEVKNEWSYTSSSPIHLRDMDKENFLFLLRVFLCEDSNRAKTPLEVACVVIHWKFFKLNYNNFFYL
jgi:hypothetical protein